ncbi:MAG: hypothetical protein JXB46_04040 [Candidatus Eisenbacteria bacterium]|nr:hypothetical protein [Candidatus Eisenbacteria bacterium]
MSVVRLAKVLVRAASFLVATAMSAQTSGDIGRAASWSVGDLSLEPVRENVHLLNVSVRRVSDSRIAQFSAEVHMHTIRDAFVAGNRLVLFGDAVKPNAVEIFDLER